MRRRFAVAIALLAAGCAARPLPIAATASAATVPDELRDTGLYADWTSLTVDAANRPYTPAFSLWSDGAKKSRWIHLPPGARVDVSNLDEWTFPVGTKLWKEFRMDLAQPDGSILRDRRVETRLLWKTSASEWQMVTYVWSADQRSARLARAEAPPPVPFPGTSSYEVPVTRCHACHDGRKDKVLGFEAVLLAAPEADPAGVTWGRLRAEGLLRTSGTLPDDDRLQLLAAASPLERQAVAYLHVNCGIACHSPDAVTMTPYFARVEWQGGAMPARIEDTAVFATAIDVPSQFVPAGGGGSWYRIRPSDETRSTILYRMSTRNGLDGGGEQMPPIDTHRIDDAGRALIAAWIRSMTAAPYPPPAP